MRISIRTAVVLLPFALACGDDGASTDAGSSDGGGRIDAPSTPRDGGTPARDSGGGDDDAGAPRVDGGGGGSTVGLLCANDENCTGAGEICCLRALPSACALETDCPTTGTGIPCEADRDCPTSRVCCRVASDQFCTTTRACDDFGGEPVP